MYFEQKLTGQLGIFREFSIARPQQNNVLLMSNVLQGDIYIPSNFSIGPHGIWSFGKMQGHMDNPRFYSSVIIGTTGRVKPILRYILRGQINQNTIRIFHNA